MAFDSASWRGKHCKVRGLKCRFTIEDYVYHACFLRAVQREAVKAVIEEKREGLWGDLDGSCPVTTISLPFA